jgi:hypothetical protein
MRSIPGFKGVYSVTDDGRIWSRPRTITRSNGTPLSVPGRWLKPQLNNMGYAYVNLYRDQSSVRLLVHRAVAMAWLPTSTPSRKQVNHKDGVKTNNVVDNLEWCTSSENRAHAHRTGLITFTEKKYMALLRLGLSKRKLSPEQVVEIVDSLVYGVPQTKLASKFNVSQHTISRIKNGTTYRNP